MKHNLNTKKKNNVRVTSAMLLSLAITIVVVGISAPLTALGSSSPEESAITTFDRLISAVLASEELIYIVWSTNETENGNEEVMFRASNDGGTTFNDTINLSNTTDAHSWGVRIDGDGSDLIVTWWETNQTSNTPVARISSDGGETFSPMLRLTANGTISSGVTTSEPRQEVEVSADTTTTTDGGATPSDTIGNATASTTPSDTTADTGATTGTTTIPPSPLLE